MSAPDGHGATYQLDPRYRITVPGEVTPAQAESGNYRKRRVPWHGLEIAIENEPGTVRRGRGWETLMLYAYGYIVGSNGVDGDPVDVYLGPDPDTAPIVYVVHQRKYGDWSAFDEDKAMIGWASQQEAEQAYLQHYDDPRFLGPVTAMPVAEFVAKVRATKEKAAMIKAIGGRVVLFLKAHIKAHTRRLKSGKVVQVAAYNTKTPSAHVGEHDKHSRDLFDHLSNAARGHGGHPPPAPSKAHAVARAQAAADPTLDMFANMDVGDKKILLPAKVAAPDVVQNSSIKKEPAMTLTPEQRNQLRKNDALREQQGVTGQGARAAWKDQVDSGRWDHLWGEHEKIVAADEAADKERRREKSDAWRARNLPKMAARRREVAAEEERRRERQREIDEKNRAARKVFAEENAKFGAEVEAQERSARAAAAASKPRFNLPTSGRVSEDDPSMYGEWLLGHEGESWASLRARYPGKWKSVESAAQLKQMESVLNEGGEGYSLSEQRKEERQRAELAAEQSKFDAEWTPEVTAKRRAAWNADMQRMIDTKETMTPAKQKALEEKHGFKMADLKRAIANVQKPKTWDEHFKQHAEWKPTDMPQVGEVFASRGGVQLVYGGDKIIQRNRDTGAVISEAPITDEQRAQLPEQYYKHLRGMQPKSAAVGSKTYTMDELKERNRAVSAPMVILPAQPVATAPKTAASTSKKYLRVPYAEKDRAKAAGARWDAAARSWYWPGGEMPASLNRWA